MAGSVTDGFHDWDAGAFERADEDRGRASERVCDAGDHLGLH